jgi:hypothetical protein
LVTAFHPDGVFQTVVLFRERTTATITSPDAIDAGIPGATVVLLAAAVVPTAPNPTAISQPSYKEG